MITLFGIKNCDTIKKARKWMDTHQIDYQFHDFRIDGIDPHQVKKWINEIGLNDLINKRSTTWKSLTEDARQSLNEHTAVELILENPTLIKRPLLDTGKELCIGFKAEHYTNIFR